MVKPPGFEVCVVMVVLGGKERRGRGFGFGQRGSKVLKGSWAWERYGLV